MRTHIFTDAERDALHRWLSGTLKREESPLLHTNLGRLRRSEKPLIQDLRLLTLALRRLHNAPKLRRRTADTETTLALAPIPIQPPEDQKRTYIRLIQPFNEAQKIANNRQTPTEDRLGAAELAARIGATLTGAGDDKPDHLIDQLEDLKQRTTKKNPDSTATASTRRA
jgi:hypothetical protein